MNRAARPDVAASTTLDKQRGRSGTVRHLRWYICGLLLYATTVNYMDRMVLSILQPTIARTLHWNSTEYGFITGVFQFGYALMMPLAGRLLDWLGLRVGYSAATLVWSLSCMSHGLAGTGSQFAWARLGLGIGEAANFPACIKAIADWFPRRERALATGVFNGGSNLGAVIAPLIVPFVAVHLGWRAAFVCTGALGFPWIILWLLFYRDPERNLRLSPEELKHIRSDREELSAPAIPYGQLLTKRPTWAFVSAKFLTDPVWWFYLFWLPDFLNRKYGVDLVHIGPPLVLVYAFSAIGSVGGGWLSSFFLHRGWRVARARKTAMLISALCVTAVMLVPSATGNLWLTVGLIGLAAAAHQGWSANLFTVVSDQFPRGAVGSVVGLGGLAGSIGGMLAQPAIGSWLDASHGAYGPLFFVAGSIYLVALVLIHWLLPR